MIFRNSVKQGEKLGNNVAAWELDRYFQGLCCGAAGRTLCVQ